MSADLLAEFGLQIEAETHSKGEDSRFGARAANPGASSHQTQYRHASTELPQTLRPPQLMLNTSGVPEIRNTDILFDAVNEAGDSDEFGEFEHGELKDADHGQPANKNSGRTNGMIPHLLGLEDATVGCSVPRTLPEHISNDVLQEWQPETGETDEDNWGNFEQVQQAERKRPRRPVPGKSRHVSEVTMGRSNVLETEWDVFDDIEMPLVPGKSTEDRLAAGSEPKSKPEKQALTTPTTRETHIEANRPSNIPPPAVLLQLLPHIFESLREENTHHFTRGTSDLATAILQTHAVASRILAGRSLRWKRDALLSQSMKIGTAGKKGGGMKLAPLDKAEAVKEEQEAAEVAASWSRHAYQFNATVVRAGIRRQQMSISLKAFPKTLRSPDVLIATHPCALCGIRRDERLSGVDTDAHDSFGEYWLEQWGHRSCFDFWEIYRGQLHQR